MMNIGAGSNGNTGVGALDQLIQTMAVEKLGAITHAPAAPTK